MHGKLNTFRENNFDARKSHADIIASDNSSKVSRALPRRRDICGSNFKEIALINNVLEN